jgi:hypothetical protein
MQQYSLVTEEAKLDQVLRGLGANHTILSTLKIHYMRSINCTYTYEDTRLEDLGTEDEEVVLSEPTREVLRGTTELEEPAARLEVALVEGVLRV